MLPRSAIQKGKELEDFIAGRLKITGLDIRAGRTPGSGNGLEKADVSNDLNLAIEAKNTKKMSLKAVWKQATDQAKGDFVKPVIAWHIPQTPLDETNVLAVISWEHFEQLLLKAKEPTLTNPDRTVAYKLKNLITAAKSFLKEIGE